MSGGWFSGLKLPDNQNTLLYSAPAVDQAVNKTQQGQLANDTAQQDLSDRAQLASLAPGLASNDPNAIAQAATLPNGGPQAINSLAQLATSRAQVATAQANMIAPPPGSPQQNLLAGYGAPLTSGAQPQAKPPMPPANFQPGSYQPGQPLFGPNAAPVSSDRGTDAAVRAAAAQANVNPDWASRIAGAESGAYRNPATAVSPAGAIGTMQLMPATAKGLGVDPSDPQQNIQGGVAYLGQLKDRFGSPVLASAAYNTGPGRVQAFLQGNASLPPETIQYVGRVFGGDGNQLLNEALAGVHGHPIPGYAPHDQMFASAQSTNGASQTMTDASGAGPQGGGLLPVTSSTLPAPSSSNQPTAMPSAPQSPMANASSSTMQAGAAQPSGQQPNQSSAPTAPAAAPLVTGAPGTAQAQQPPFDPSRVVHRANGLPFNDGLQPGYTRVYDDNNNIQIVRDPRIPVEPKFEIKDGLQYVTDPTTGKSISVTRVAPSTSRITEVQGPDGTELYQDGQKINTVPFSGRDAQAAAYKTDQDHAQTIIQAGHAAETSAARLNEINDLVQQLQTGPGTQARANVAAWVQSTFGPGVASDFANKITNISNPSVAQELIKLNTQQSGDAAKATTGGNTGAQSIQIYQNANPGLNLLPDANQRVTNLMRVSNQAQLNYSRDWLTNFQNSENSFTNGGKYVPQTLFDKQWLSQNNPRVYAASAGILNGDSYDRWSAGLSPQDALKAVQYAGQIDPRARVPVYGGALKSVQDPSFNPNATPKGTQ